MNPRQPKKNLLVFMFFVFALEVILFSAGNAKLNSALKKDEERIEKIQNVLDSAPILAKAVSVYDATINKKIYGKNDNVALPIASLAKIMTVVVGLNGHRMDDIIYVSPNAVNQTGDFGIFANEKWKIGDLARFTLIVSANDGAYTLAEEDDNFLEEMNNKARKIGMENTLFLNFTGLDLDPEHVGAYASAEDANLMAVYALRAHPEIFQATKEPEINLKSESGFNHNFKNTDTLVGKISNLLFSKTGFTDLAGGSLSVIFKNKNGHKIAVTVLGSTFDGRFSDMEKIVDVLSRFP